MESKLNLETKIPIELWKSIKTNYEKNNFTGSVLDAFHFLSDLIRTKSGVEGDGSALIGSAFGGAAPKIKINKLQSESELSAQKGLEQLLRGMYQVFRNPRSHEKITDNAEDSQVIIVFIGYIVRQIDLAKSQFSREEFLKRIFDPDFVPQERYAKLLVEEIPASKRLEVFLDIYRAKATGKVENLRYFFDALLPELNTDELEQVYRVISEELKTTDDEASIRVTLGALGRKTWQKISETAKLRIENRIIKSTKEGRHDLKSDRTRDGALGTWITTILPHMTLKEHAITAISDSIKSGNIERENYIFKYVFKHMTFLSTSLPGELEGIFIEKIESGNIRFLEALKNAYPWGRYGSDLEDAIENFQEAIPTFDPFDDDIPF